jgi:hypothetical protein
MAILTFVPNTSFEGRLRSGFGRERKLREGRADGTLLRSAFDPKRAQRFQ